MIPLLTLCFIINLFGTAESNEIPLEFGRSEMNKGISDDFKMTELGKFKDDVQRHMAPIPNFRVSTVSSTKGFDGDPRVPPPPAIGSSVSTGTTSSTFTTSTTSPTTSTTTITTPTTPPFSPSSSPTTLWTSPSTWVTPSTYKQTTGDDKPCSSKKKRMLLMLLMKSDVVVTTGKGLK